MNKSNGLGLTFRGYQVTPVVIVGLVMFGLLIALSVLPARTWLSQRSDAQKFQAETERLEKNEAELLEKQEKQSTDAEVEKIARRDYGYVYPGEEQFEVVPPE